jgi:hypothetical protein
LERVFLCSPCWLWTPDPPPLPPSVGFQLCWITPD